MYCSKKRTDIIKTVKVKNHKHFMFYVNDYCIGERVYG